MKKALVMLALAALTSSARAQAPLAPAGTSPMAAQASAYSWPSATINNPYPTVALPRDAAPSGCARNEDENGRLLVGDPLLDSSPWACGLGWFAAIEVDAVGSHLNNRLQGNVAVGGRVVNVALPSADLDWTAMPHVELGYRFGQAAGELLLAYHGMSVRGADTIAGFGAAGIAAPLTSHLNLHVVDIDYANRENCLGPLWDMKWRAGIRIATLSFDSTALTPVLSEQETNSFTGGGLHIGLALKRRLGATGLALLGAVDAGTVLGQVHQTYSVAVPGAPRSSTDVSANEPAPSLEVRLGLEYDVRQLPNLHFSTGYLFERWWAIGETFGSQGQATYQGVFCRGEWRY